MQLAGTPFSKAHQNACWQMTTSTKESWEHERNTGFNGIKEEVFIQKPLTFLWSEHGKRCFIKRTKNIQVLNNYIYGQIVSKCWLPLLRSQGGWCCSVEQALALIWTNSASSMVNTIKPLDINNYPTLYLSYDWRFSMHTLKTFFKEKVSFKFGYIFRHLPHGSIGQDMTACVYWLQPITYT